MGDQATYLEEIKLYEVSLVTIAMNEKATIQGMKSEEQKNYFDTAFDRLIAVERNDSIKYELLKLKNQIDALIEREPETKQEHTPPPEPPATLTKSDILQILNS